MFTTWVHIVIRGLLLAMFQAAAHASGGLGGVSPQSISLPTGAGSLEGLGEKYQPHLNSGTFSYSVPFKLPSVRGTSPGLSLDYDSGRGNGPIGMGWSISVPAIRRQTDKGLPLYTNTDLFCDESAQELVHLADDTYRYKIEGGFIQYRRSESGGWIAKLPSGVTMRLGSTATSRLDFQGKGTFCWMVDSIQDLNGNRTEYDYLVDQQQIYLKEIRYGLHSSAASEFIRIQCDYLSNRVDAFVDCRGRFASTNRLLLRTVTAYLGTRRIREWDLDYTNISSLSLLSAVVQFGDDRSQTGTNALENLDFLPPTRFTYTQSEMATDGAVRQIGFGENEPNFAFGEELGGAGGPHAEFVDIDHDGLPDILINNPDSSTPWRSLLNPGPFEDGWPTSRVITNAPAVSGANLGSRSTRLVDLRGDGKSKLLLAQEGQVDESATAFDYYDFESPSALSDPQRFITLNGILLADSQVQFVDLDNDKAIDLLRLNPEGNFLEGLFTRNFEGKPNEYVAKATPGDNVPDFDRGWQLADVNGDRLQDLVLLQEGVGNVAVALNMGWGDFAAPYWMKGGPGIGDLEPTGSSGPHLIDLNQDGLADLVIIYSGLIRIWLNQNGTAWSDPIEITENIPSYEQGVDAVRFADINGNGSTDIIWHHGTYPSIRYLDLFPQGKAFLLHHAQSTLGGTVDIAYRSSTDFMAESIGTTNAWTQTAPFPVPVVSETVDSDGLGNSYTNRFTYRNAYYDPIEHQFRGFEEATDLSIGDESQGAPSLATNYRFDVGATNEAMKGKMLRIEAGDGTGGVFYRTTNQWTPRILHLPLAASENRPVVFAVQTNRITQEVELGSETKAITLEESFDYDDYGNPTFHANYGIVQGTDRTAYDDERITSSDFAINADSWILRTPKRMELKDVKGIVLSRTDFFYDDETFSGTNWGAVTVGNLTMKREWTNAASMVGFINSSRTKYDIFGNPKILLDPLADAPGGVINFTRGHGRELAYDDRLHSRPVKETIHLGDNNAPLVFQARYDDGLGTVTNSTDFNGNTTAYAYDTFARLINVVRPGDTPDFPTAEYSYLLAVPSGEDRSVNYVETRQLDKIPGSANTKRDHYFISRQFVDGLGRKRLTKTEAEPAGGSTVPRVVVGGATLFNSRRQPARVLNPFFSLQGSTLDDLLGFEDIESHDWRGQFQDGGSLATLDLASAHSTRTGYDATLRPTQVINPDGASRRMVYEPLRTRTYDENDNDPATPFFDTPMVHYNDGLGRLIRVDEISRLKDDGTPAGTLKTWTTLYQYDINDQLTQITDSQNNIKTFAYDGLKRKTSMNDPDRGVMNFVFDDASNLVESTDAKGQRITYTYDGANRILTEDYHDEGLPFSRNFAFNPLLPVSPANRPDVAYFYDEPQPGLDLGDGSVATASNTKGKLAYVWDLSGEEHTSFDARERVGYVVKRVRDPLHGQLVSYRTGFAYDSLDRITTLTYPDNDSIGYRYNDRNLLSRIVGGPTGSIISNLVYFPSCQQGEILYGNGIGTGYAYDSRLRLKTLVTAPSANSASPLIAFGYDFDGVSNIKSITDNRPGSVVPAGDKRRNTQLFQYDDLYRLTRVQYSFTLPGAAPANDGEINYRYDRIGDMLAQTSSLNDTDLHTGLPVANLGIMSSGGGTSGRFNRTGRNASDPPGPHALTAISNPQSAVPDRAFPYDANGNMTSLDGMVATWDFKDRLLALEDATMRAEYAYDFTNRRITKRVTKKTAPAGALVPRVAYPYTTVYVGKHFEVREFDAPTKFVWNDNTRVARVTGTLSPNQRLQRLRVNTGWNLVAVAVTAQNGGAQLAATGQTDGIYQWKPVTRDFAVLLPTNTVSAGSVLWVKALADTTLRVMGLYSGPMPNLRGPPEGDFVPGHGLEVLPLTNQPASLTVWRFAPDLQNWQTTVGGFPDFSSSDLPSALAPHEALYALAPASADLEVPNPTISLRFYHHDHIGSSSVMTDAVGAVIEESANYPFGQPRSEFLPRSFSEDYQFTQKERDAESGLNHQEARFYLTTIGRFVSVDPLVDSTRTAYLYGNNNPIRYVDPTGKNASESAEWVNNNVFNGELRGEASRLWELSEGDNSLEAYGDRAFAVTAYILATVDDGITIASFGGKAVVENAAKRGIKTLVESGEKVALKESVEVATKTEANLTRGWKVGDPINNLTSKGNVPAWDTVRQRFWKNEALNNPAKHSAENLSRMERGLAPQRLNANTGKMESMELHHTPAQRDGGLFDVEPLWPDQHAAVDPYRHTGN